MLTLCQISRYNKQRLSNDRAHLGIVGLAVACIHVHCGR